jgi:hypothetical protein
MADVPPPIDDPAVSPSVPPTDPSASQTTPETDDRFPSGRWVGFFLQKGYPGRQKMELILRFSAGVVQGEGRDRIGDFLIRGRYQTDDGRCHWHKRYVGRHDVFYQGYNEGKGVWGLWEIASDHFSDRGGFHIWPEGMADPTVQQTSTAAEPPVSFDETDAFFSEEQLEVDTLETAPSGA